ncbi:uncharacterized protein LOC105664600 [Ceratitis capitata]|uniref:uncharacterized protein LOC105664600 n=1 Tax=Ceratitis capitata TaxID=7213 RepID=UPI0006189507|nr:uncharacterized protein LOC105664600 [Ceratitis capitata]
MSRMPLGPGPAAYMLPSAFGYYDGNQLCQHAKGYSFGLRGKDLIKKIGPGPGAYRTFALTRYGRSRYFKFT